MITAVIFDMDGVIADSEYFNVKAKHLILKHEAVLFRIGCAFTDLAFNGFFSLAVSGITGIDHGSHGRHLAFFTSVNGGAFIRTNVSYNLYTIFCNEVQ